MKHPYEYGALVAFVAVSSKEWQDQWIDRGEIGANAVGALLSVGTLQLSDYLFGEDGPRMLVETEKAGARVWLTVRR